MLFDQIPDAKMPPRAEPPSERQELEVQRQMTVERINTLDREKQAEEQYLAKLNRRIRQLERHGQNQAV